MMRYRLRTLLIALALGPLLIAWTFPPAYRAVKDWLWPSKPTQTDFDRVVGQLLAEIESRPAIRGRLIDDFGEQKLDRLPPLADEPSLSDEINRLFPPVEARTLASDMTSR